MALLRKSGAALIVENTSERRGAITPELYETIREAVSRANEARAIILTGGAFFCSGGDLHRLRTRAALSLEARRQKIEALHETVRQMRASPVPVIAAVEGGAAGAGLSLVMACDMIIAGESATFTAAYVKAGLVPDGGLTHALRKALPRQAVMEMCLLGQPVSARRLAELGVVNRLCADGSSLAEAEAMAAMLAEGPRGAQASIRGLITAAEDGLEAQLDREAQAMAEAQGGAEAAEGIAAFLDKRKPEFGP